MKSITLRTVSNGFVVVVPKANEPGKMNMDPPAEHVFNTWDQVTTFLTNEGFIK